MVLLAFLAAQADRTSERAYPYLLANAVGSGAMAATAVLSEDWGFVFLEVVWTAIATWGILRRVREAPA